MAIRVRPYVDDDLPRLADALAGWIHTAGACGYYHVGHLHHWIYATLRGRRPVGELVQIWEDNRGIVGVSINGLFETAFHVFASPAYRGTDGELAMLQSAIETTGRFVQPSARDNTPVTTDVFSCDATRIKLLEQLGLTEYRLWDHITERGLGEPIPKANLPDGFSIRIATMDDYEQLALVHNDAFMTDWTPETYRDEVMRKPGYNPKRAIVVVAPDRQIAAFTMIWLDKLNKVGLFEPVGTRRNFQRRGLARALMLYGLREMQQRGMETAMVDHDATNQAALELYCGLGFRKKYETLGYQRA